MPLVHTPIIKPPVEDLESLGKAWGRVKSRAFYEVLKKAGREGAKVDVARLAKAAGVSTDFVRSLRGYDVRYEGNKAFYKNRESSGVAKVLAVLGVSESAFLTMVAVRS